MTDVRWERRSLAIGVAALAVVAALTVFDLVADRGTGVGPAHLIAEGLVIAVATAGAGALLHRLRALAREHRRLHGQLATTRAEAERWRAEARDALEGLAAAIDRQFDRWELTPAEREVGILLLRGLSHKEVAKARGASERTVRQQAHGLYRKAGLEGRADLAAFFLDSLGLPR